VASADASDVSIRSSTRVHDFVNRGPELDGLYVYPPVLAACCQVIGRLLHYTVCCARIGQRPNTR
jgi:hypothetical protein